ncbi:hypothetical protein P7K49_040231 [Saguinus oedipus]|uniref:Uncharacterized protein n=1 Tax=Saguinus oedipus TaxID=9490 RepID=A0ABQ9T8P2_SAGOE|nr:hypothetical protein P7K49_040231 [Saguinus oedipus]
MCFSDEVARPSLPAFFTTHFVSLRSSRSVWRALDAAQRLMWLVPGAVPRRNAVPWQCHSPGSLGATGTDACQVLSGARICCRLWGLLHVLNTSCRDPLITCIAACRMTPSRRRTQRVTRSLFSCLLGAGLPLHLPSSSASSTTPSRTTWPAATPPSWAWPCTASPAWAAGRWPRPSPGRSPRSWWPGMCGLPCETRQLRSRLAEELSLSPSRVTGDER